MPVDFLTPEQENRYGRFSDKPSVEQLSRYFLLDDTDLKRVTQCRGDNNRLGFAVQLGTVRFLGTFLVDPTDLPTNVLDFVTTQLGLSTPSSWVGYAHSKAHWEHVAQIQRFYGYRTLNDAGESFRLTRWLYTRAWLSADRPSVLFDLATTRLVARKVLLPGVTTLARLVASIRDRVSIRMWRLLSRLPNSEQRAQLESLLVVPEGARQSRLDRLRQAPSRISGPALVGALIRLVDLRSLGVSHLSLDRVPANRLKTLARYAATTWAAKIARMPTERRIATLLSFAQSMEVAAMDDALDLFDLLVTDITKRATLDGKNERFRTLRDLDEAALELQEVCKVILDVSCNDEELRGRIFEQVPRERLLRAVLRVAAIARPSDDQYYQERVKAYSRVRQFLPSLLTTITFQHAPAGQAVADAIKFLTLINGQRTPDMKEAPLGIVSGPWRRCVVGTNQVAERRAYTLCALERIQDSLRRRDLFVEKSERWGDPRTKLLSKDAWQSVRPRVCQILGRRTSAKEELSWFGQQLDEAYRRTLVNMPSNQFVRIEQEKGRERIVLTPLDKLEEPASLVCLQERLALMLPKVELPEMLLEIHNRTGFAKMFTHINESEARVADLAISVCAVLIAEACNIGLEPLTQEDQPALTRNRLSWVQQNYFRAETLIQANARLVNEQNKIPLAHEWGGGEVASADGLRFVVPVRTVNAGPNPKYFGVGRGVTYYNFTSDQFTGFHSIVVPGTLRDSIFILDGLLEQQTDLKPLEIMSDTAGVSDLVFGLFWLLGYQFSPRLADMGEARFWRMNPLADYGALNSISRHKINTGLIENHWDEMLRVAGSLTLGKVSASELIRSLLQSERPSTLAKAIGELGRVPKSIHLLAYMDDDNYRRRILTQLNRQEGRNGVARVTFHGKRGEMRKPYREGQEDQLSALGLVVNIITLWNTLYMDAILNRLRKEGFEVKPGDVPRLSPLVYKHINFLGRFSFNLSEPIARGELRPFRNPEQNP